MAGALCIFLLREVLLKIQTPKIPGGGNGCTCIVLSLWNLSDNRTLRMLTRAGNPQPQSAV